ncbi:MAG: ATP-binding cassette domain-containing protein [Phycisphaerae bacterium]|nr:ATP-binding cassette domain-containing protein [Phycisphaerae bacterium]
MPIIEVNNVSKCFYLRYARDFIATGLVRRLFSRKHSEEFWALRNVSFSVERGESLGVIGPNGSGKTTLLSIVSGVTQPTQGSVCTAGRISALLQLGAGFHPDLTGRENVYINAGVLGFRRKEINKIYPSIAEFSELGSFLEAPIRRYSSGMLARLGFSIAMHVDPDVIIVDEVLGVGDQRFQVKCQERILDFVDRGVTILFVSHSAAQVRKLCTRAVYLEQGDLAAYGDVEDVLAAYASRGDKGPTIGTGAQSGPDARPKPADKPTDAKGKTPADKDTKTAPGEAPPKPRQKKPPTPTGLQPEPLPPSAKIRPIKYAPSGRFAPSSAGVPATTFFYRNAPQVAYLFDEVFPAFPPNRPIRVRCWECSIGAEPYTVAIESARRKDRQYVLAIEGLDRDPELVQGAVQAEYNETELFYNGFGRMPRDLLDAYFEENAEGNYVLCDEVRFRVLFGVGDILSKDCTRLPPAEVLLCQNTLMHMPPADATRALANLISQAAPGAVVALAGTDPDLLVEAVQEYALQPITDRIEEIHDGWRFRRSRPDAPWGLRPIDRSEKDWEIRNCSLFRVSTPKA